MKKVLTIAGSDCCGGAGIQADLKTFAARGVYGMSAITAVTAQNTVRFDGTIALPADFVKLQIDSVMSDIGADVWKTGMLVGKEIVEAVVNRVNHYNIKQLVVDPVMVSKTVGRLLEKQAIESLVKKLLPLATIITPNIDEAQVITNIKIINIIDMKKAAVILYKMGAANVVVKGGHLNSAADIFFDGNKFYELKTAWVKTKNTHGTGCTFASCIAAEMAKGKSVKEAVEIAKDYVTEALQRSVNIRIGKGNGPLFNF